jgi:predicted glycogen debranching enzyme
MSVDNRLSRSSFTHLPAAMEREWLVTNGLGGFAAGTIAQANTRRYHALLTAALRPPLGRTVLVAKVDITARCGDRLFALACNEFADGTIAPRGFELLEDFRLEHGIPVWIYALEDARLEQRIWMHQGHNTSRLSLTLTHSLRPVALELTPLCTYRDYHGSVKGGWSLEVTAEGSACVVRAFAGACPYRLGVDRGEFHSSPDWYWRFFHREEAARGLDPVEDLFRPGVFRALLRPGETLLLVASAEADEYDGETSYVDEIERRRKLLRKAGHAPGWIGRLTLAADAFLVRRAATGVSVIAGYPWFGDWGRDTMIALCGLTLATDRAEDAAPILRTFGAHASQGMLPNRFPDAGSEPEYNTADATLWYFQALEAYLDATGDRQLLAELYPLLKEIIHWHRKGTRYGIHVDERDGLLHVGEPGVQLTWMDAKVGDWVVTPRTGKPVEINALWHRALDNLAGWAAAAGDTQAAADYARGAARVACVFAPAFWYESGGYLYDVIDGDGGADTSLRPNQIFALSLGGKLLDDRRARSVLEVCTRELLTPVGLRSLARTDPRYVGRYEGDVRSRDAAYHQGTVWSWLLGPFALAHYRVHGDAAHALGFLDGLAPHLDEACLGTISEIFDGDAPHAPRGCFAQAWSVGETLRAWHILARARAVRETPLSRAGGRA